jgi:hypothetical protein
MKTLVAVMSITFLISCGGGDVRHHYAQVSGPSPAGHVFLVINSECAYTIKLENSLTKEAKRLHLDPSDTGYRIKVLGTKLVLVNALTQGESLSLASGNAVFRSCPPHQLLSLNALLGSVFTWKVALVERGGATGAVLLSVDFRPLSPSATESGRSRER